MSANNYTNAVLADSPTLYWKLNETSGTVAADSSGNGNNGTYTGGFTLGKLPLLRSGGDASVLFNNSTGYITSSYSPFTANSSMTFEAWASRNVGDFDSLIASSSNTAGPNVRLTSAGTTIRWWSAQSGTAIDFTSVTANTLNVPFHWAATYNDSTQAIEMFVNGVSLGVQTAGEKYAVSPGTFQVGMTGTATNPFGGNIGQVAVYSGILASSRILAHYMVGAASFSNNYQFVRADDGMSVSEKIR